MSKNQFSKYTRAGNRADLGGVIKMLVENRKLLFTAIVLGMFSGLLLYTVIPAKFAAKAVIMPPQQDRLPLEFQNLTNSPLAMLAWQNKMTTGELYIDILQSDRAAGEIIRWIQQNTREQSQLLAELSTKSNRDAIETLRQMTIIDESPAGLISVEIIGDSPKMTAQIANAYFAVLDSILQRQNRQQNAATRRYLEEQLAENTRKLQKASDSLAYYRSRFKIIAPLEQAAGTLGQLSELKGQLLAKEIEIRMMEKTMQADNPKLLFAREKYAALKDQYAALQSRHGQAKDVFTSFGILPEILVRLGAFERQVKMYEQVWQFLSAQLQRTKFHEKQNMPVITYLNRAVPDEKPVSPILMMIVPVMTFVVTTLTTVFLLIREFIWMPAQNEIPAEESSLIDDELKNNSESAEKSNPALQIVTEVDKI